MATAKETGNFLEFDEYVEFQLDKTRQAIKWTDLLVAIAGVAVLGVGYLLLFVVADHWLFAGGVPPRARIISFAVVLLLALIWLAWKAVLPIWRRVSDLYAANMLERSDPTLRGHLIGLVDSRRAGRLPAEEVREALEKRSAMALSTMDVDSALDRKTLMRIFYVLSAMVLIACAYAIFSPKRVGPSLLRAMAPGTSVGVATRTEILTVQPKDISVLAGEQPEISVQLRGERPEKVWLYFSTADRRFLDEPQEMILADETTREYRTTLLGDAGRGLTQDMTYRIEAGDDQTRPYRITVEHPPNAAINSIAMQFPAYTGLSAVEQAAPPIEAIEGTRVQLVATANRPLKSATLQFADDLSFQQHNEEVGMTVSEDGLTLRADWTLRRRGDGTAPSAFRIQCRDRDGKSSPNPAVYPISIIADEPPEVTLHDPKSDIERPANAVIPLMITARDPDFALRELTLHIEKDGQEIPARTVIWEGAQQEIGLRHDWKLEELALQPGDEITYFLQVQDNREPDANRRNSPKLRVRIIEPVSDEEVEQQLAEDIARQQQQPPPSENDPAEQPPMPEQPSPAEPSPSDSADQEQSTSEPNKSSEEGMQQPKANEPSEGAGEDRATPPVKNDGSEDEKVIRELMERQQQRQDNAQQPPQDGQQQSDGPQGQEGTQGGQEGMESGSGSGSEKAGAKQNVDQQSPSTVQAREPGETGDEKQPGGPTDQDMQESTGSEGTQPSDGEMPRPENQETTPENRGMGPNEQNPGGQQPGGQTGESSANDTAMGEAATPSGSGPKGPQDAAGAERPNPGESGNTSGESSPGEPASSEPSQGGPAMPKDEQPNDNAPSATGETTNDATTQNSTDQSPGGENETTSGEGGAMSGEQPGEPTNGTEPGEPPARQEGLDPSREGDSLERGGAMDNQQRPTEERSGGTANEQERQQGTMREGQDEEPGESPEGRPAGDPSAQPASDNSPTQSSPTQSDDQNGGMPGESDQQPGAMSQGEGSQPGESSSSDPDGQPGGQGSPSPTGEPQPGESQGDQTQPGEPQPGDDSQTGGKAMEDGPSGDPTGDSNSSSQEGGTENQPSGNPEGSQEGNQGQSESPMGANNDSGEGSNQPGGEPSEQSPSGQSPTDQSPANGGGTPGEMGDQGTSSTNQPGSAGGGTPGERSAAGDSEPPPPTPNQPDPAHPEFSRETTNLILDQLENDLQRGEVDPELLEELGWTNDDMRRFADRLRGNLSDPTGNESPEEQANRAEFQNMLENMSFRKSAGPREASDSRVRDVEGVGTINPPVPSEYRDAYERFTRQASGLRGGDANP